MRAFFLLLIMNNKELVITWISALIGSGLQDLNLVMSSIAYTFTITFTGIQIYKHLKKNKNGK